MDETELISVIQSRLADRLSRPVRTAGIDGQRPVPSVFIKDWDTNEMNFHNSPFSGESGFGASYERTMTFDFETRVEFEAQHTDQVEASRLSDALKQELRLIRATPTALHADLKQCRLGGSGSPSFNFVEPTETKQIVSARFHADHTITLGPDDLGDDPIQTISKTFTFE